MCQALQRALILTTLYNIYYPNFTHGKLRFKELKCSIQEHISTEKKKIKNSNVGLSPKPMLFPQTLLWNKAC